MVTHRPKSALLLQTINPSAPTSPATTTSCRPIPSSSAATGFERRTKSLSYTSDLVPDDVARYHTHSLNPNQCCSSEIQEIFSPIETVWSIVRRFDKPQAYKQFIKSCYVIIGDGDIGTLRKVDVVSGLPATNSIERLDILDDERHVSGFSIIGGDHRLENYRSVTTLHQSAAAAEDGRGKKTVVVESYVVDIPAGNTCEETCIFVGTIVKCNLKGLKLLSEDLAARNASLS